MQSDRLVDIGAELGQTEDGDVVVAAVEDIDVVAVGFDRVRVVKAAALLLLVEAEDKKLVAALIILEDSAGGIVENVDELVVRDRDVGK